MERRRFLIGLPVTAAVVAFGTQASAELAPDQDHEFIRAWERAQKLRPRALTSNTRIAPAGEPGIPMRIECVLLQRDGKRPAPGITVFAYHTDAAGHYDVAANGPHSWRLKAWAITDAQGRFSFTTIRPAPYPGRNIAAHVHVYFQGPGQPRRATEIEFADDPLVAAATRRQSDAAGQFGIVRPVTVRDGVQVVEARFRISDEGVF
jgi:protocatechuate 3,4-dioxygenase beta subunit